MSLINTVLQDLEKRQASEVRSSLHREVRPLPTPPRRRVGAWLGLLLLPPALLAIHAYWPGTAVLLPASTPGVAAQAAPGSLSAGGQAVGTAVPEVMPVSPIPTASALPGETEIALRLSPLLDTLPEVALSMSPAPTSAALPVAPRGASSVLSPAASRTVAPAASQTAIPAVPALPAVAPARPAAASTQPRALADLAAEARAVTEGEGVARPPADGSTSPSVRVDKRPAEGGAVAREPFEEEHQRALSRWRAGAATEAGGLLAELLRRQPGLVQARQSLARLLIEQQRPEDAMRVLADGLREHPRQAPWALALARLQAERGEVAAALHTLEALRDHAETPEYLGFHAHLLHRQGRFREAAERFQRAARGAPHEGRWWVGLGFALEADARPEAALDAFRRARATGNLDAGLAAVVDQKLK
jgi:MSHA biogenesis protein MshN